MSATLERQHEQEQEHRPERFRFSTNDYEKLAEAGILVEDDRLELIEGDILRMSPIGKFHVWCVARLNYLLTRRLGDRAVVLIQSPIRLDGHSEPEPDVAVVRPQEQFFGIDLPTPADILLLIEVSDSSLAYDRDVKLALYARAEIPEVWLVDLNTDTFYLYARPSNGAYQSIQTYRRGDTVTSATLPDLALRVEEILGPASA
jgi:Uma2 family endonuclease